MAENLHQVFKEMNILFNTHIKKKADVFENERKKCAKKVRILNTLAIISVVAFIFFMTVPIHHELSFKLPLALQNNNFAIILSGLFFLVTLLFLTPLPYIFLAPAFALIANIFKQKFVMKIKKEFYSHVFKAIGGNLNYHPGKIKFIPDYIAGAVPLFAFIQEIANLIIISKDSKNIKIDSINGAEILPAHDGFSPDDIIWGKYNKRKVEIIEFDLYRTERTKSSESTTNAPTKVFHGVTFQTNIDKTINAKIYIKQKNSDTALNNKTLEKIVLESSEFNKIYDVYSNDQVEARYFLTTSTLERLINLYNKGQIISLWCQNNDISIIKKTSKDLFEPDLYKPINDPASYYETLIQTQEILDFITNLKLDVNIGM